MARVSFEIIRISRRRALRAARNMALAGWNEAVISRVLGLSRARCRDAINGQGLWSREERRAMLLAMAVPQVAQGAIGKCQVPG